MSFEIPFYMHFKKKIKKPAISFAMSID